ncbi:Golgi integral membrane protein 4 isoform X1 [Callorhinchus milii]|uniref:Golgi integral membrane protein 4 isoform X1 n=1 Tax=Callorhinchus milii TaxID=7868 RepID=UPI001C3FBFCA|nr:Golgi integral membrane protein 4 isoform X1 [Callorhinchus milii]
MYSDLRGNLRSAEVLAQKYKQQQETVSAQLQVVYEHRSRLERSLQKERGDHKKTKEDFLVYKLEAQEALSKEKQDAMNRYSALSSQHKILKSQQDDVRKQLQDLQLQHNSLKLEHRKALDHHTQSQQQKQAEISHLQDSVSLLKEESKQLRRAHQQVHTQLQQSEVQPGAQAEEFRQLKDALHKMPSFKRITQNAAMPWVENQALRGQPPVPGNNHWQVPAQKELTARPLDRLVPGGQAFPAPPDRGDGNPQGIAPEHPAFRGQGPGLAGWAGHGPRARSQEESVNRVVRFTRTVNSLQPGATGTKPELVVEGKTLDVASPQGPLLAGRAGERPKPFIVSDARPDSRETENRGKLKSWNEVINDVSRRGQAGQNLMDLERTRGQDDRDAQWANIEPAEEKSDDDEDLDIEDELDEPDEKPLLRNFGSRKGSIVQEPLIPGAEQDPAQDPNNQGEDEFEEAEQQQQPSFAAKGALDTGKEPDLFLKQEPKGHEGAGQNGDEGMENYQEDQEAEIEDHAGEIEDDNNLID